MPPIATPPPEPPPPTQPASTLVPASTPGPTSTSVPSAASQAAAAATPETSPSGLDADQRALEVRLWNGSAELQLDGRTIEPGRVLVSAGPHQLAALVDGDVVAIVDAPPDGGPVDLVLPPPQAALAIMIENQADARPQTGLPDADVVYEALAEGGITRFIGVFLAGDAAVVGPVRSLRHYFAFLAADYGADVVHIGASPEGFTWRDAMNMGYLDESAGDPGVWRVRTRPPPHNAYTGTAADRDLLAQRGRQANREWGPLRFSADAPRGETPADNLTLGFQPWAYSVSYAWDADAGRYLRFMEGLEHRDAATGEQIAPATVVVQFANVTPIPGDPKLRLDVDLVGGSGDLVVFSSGTRREGTWTKAAPRTPTTWLDIDGSPLVIPPGPVWVEVAPLGSPLTSS
ncbi:MAG: DUF3048 domain-containing protein [Chloroflexota bacterium]|nr:DUF3048 domain-containing protein [Chloroflexota bacterium]